MGPEAVNRLARSRVTIVGLGAVGGHALEALVRSGVGSFVLADFDVICDSNFNRQLLAVEPNLGRKKAEAARDRVFQINPRAVVSVFDSFVHRETLPALFAERPDLVIDAIDAVNPKTALLEYCWRSGIPVVSSMGAGQKSDPLALRRGDLMDSSTCPLAKTIRKYLRNRGVGRGITAVWSDEVPRPLTVTEEETAAYQAGEYSRGRPRRPIGSLPTITGIFGLTVAQTGMDMLLGEPSVEPPHP
jgi:tRNA A37 threonylcarbamoyladenosine dehydratase